MSFQPFREGDHPDLSYVLHENPVLFSPEAKENYSCLDVAIEKTRKAIKDQDHPELNEKILTSFLDYKESLP